MRIHLYTCTGDFVAREWMLPMPLALPEVVIWGERFFILQKSTVEPNGRYGSNIPPNNELCAIRYVHNGKTPPCYVEGYAFLIPQPEMFKDIAQALTAAGSLPDDCR